MDESKPTSAATASSTAPDATALKILTPQQQQLYQRQLMFLHQCQQQQQHSQQQSQPNIMNPNLLSLHQQQQQLQQQQQQQQQQQSIMSRFPSNIDAHLRPPGMRSSNFNQASIPNSSAVVNNVAAVQHQMQHQMQQIQQQQVAQTVKSATAAQTAAAAAARQGGNPKELELAQQDALMVTNPDLKRPFDSIEDAVNRLLPYHILADYEAEEEDSILNSDSTGQVPSRQQQWDHNILSKVQEFNNTYEKQVLAFNIMTKKRCVGEFRSEERLMMEQLLLQDEMQAINDIKAENESKERASREAAEAQMRMAMAQAELARAQAQMSRPAPIMRSSALIPSQGDDDDDGSQDVMHAWGSAANNRNEEPAEDFLNDEHEDEEADDDDDDDEDDDGELDLNERQ